MPKYTKPRQSKKAIDAQNKDCQAYVDNKTWKVHVCDHNQEEIRLLQLDDFTKPVVISWQPTLVVNIHPCTQKNMERRGDLTICYYCSSLKYETVLWNRRIGNNCYNNRPIILHDEDLFHCVWSSGVPTFATTNQSH